jgi:hypothetical protein
MEMRKESNVAYIFVLGIILGAALLYFPPYAWAWVGDDYIQFDYVLEFLKRPLSAIQLLNPYFLPWYYRPLQNFWFLGNRAVFGLTPAAFYWQMVLWHSVATALVYRVLRQFGERPFSAMLATALFAIHGHYVDVVGWNSSVAIVMAMIFSLVSLSAYLEFLTAKDAKSVRKNKYLIFSFLFFVLALLTHEEAILLPLFLIVLTMVKGRKQKSKKRWWQTESWKERFVRLFTLPQMVILAGMLILTAVSIVIQFTRPNLTINISEKPAVLWLELISPTHVSQFIKDISLRYTITANWSTVQSTAPLLLAIIILLLFGAWFLMGSWTVRLGLIWAALHLGLIYATLWQSKPNLLAGRHFYQASFGLVLAIGGSIDQLREIGPPRVHVGRWRISVVMAGIVAVITVILISHILSVQTTQQKWLNRAETEKSTREQMKALLPEIGEDTRVFANRFPISPTFFRAVTEIWYELDAPIPQPSGSFTQLERHGQATDDFYVFDYEDGELYNLMPELQAADETVFIWSRNPRLDVVSDEGELLKIRTNKGEHSYATVDSGEERQFAVSLAPTEVVEGWLTLTYLIPSVPAHSALHLSIRTDADSGAFARVRLDSVLSASYTVFDEKVNNDWVEVEASMNDFPGRMMLVRLETAVAPGGTVYWGNPRLVIEE